MGNSQKMAYIRKKTTQWYTNSLTHTDRHTYTPSTEAIKLNLQNNGSHEPLSGQILTQKHTETAQRNIQFQINIQIMNAQRVKWRDTSKLFLYKSAFYGYWWTNLLTSAPSCCFVHVAYGSRLLLCWEISLFYQLIRKRFASQGTMDYLD